MLIIIRRLACVQLRGAPAGATTALTRAADGAHAWLAVLCCRYRIWRVICTSQQQQPDTKPMDRLQGHGGLRIHSKWSETCVRDDFVRRGARKRRNEKMKQYYRFSAFFILRHPPSRRKCKHLTLHRPFRVKNTIFFLNGANNNITIVVSKNNLCAVLIIISIHRISRHKNGVHFSKIMVIVKQKFSLEV